jgi:hypothetical protein
MTRAIIAVIVYGVLLGAPVMARVTIHPWAHPQYLTGHPAAADDAAVLAAVWAQIDTGCPCDSFTPTTNKSAHPDYVACAGLVVLEAL